MRRSRSGSGETFAHPRHATAAPFRASSRLRKKATTFGDLASEPKFHILNWLAGISVALAGLTIRETRGTGEEGEVAKEDRGFASMDRAKQREIASKGGKAAHQKGTAHEWTSEEARDAGRKGGIASHQRRREQNQPSDRDMASNVENRGAGMESSSSDTERTEE
jgi:uncharacterized protein